MKLKKFENFEHIDGEYEDDEALIVTKIIEHFPYEETKSKMENDGDMDPNTILIDMINWYEHNSGKQIADEISVMKRLEDEYDFLNNQ